MPNVAKPAHQNLSGGIWLLADMSLNIFALSIVKALGLGYPATQIVFLRACAGMVILLPWAIYARHCFIGIEQWKLHALRVLLSAMALTASFFAVSRLPFALVSTISFTRPILTMIMAVIFLREVVSRRRWIAATLAFIGILIALKPGTVQFNWGIPAMGLAAFFGTSAIILTRKLSSAPTIVMMMFYTAGLTALTAPFALNSWVTVPSAHIVPLLAIGAFAQCAQFCFLYAHTRAEAGFLAVLGYFSFVLSTAVGYLYFNEVPSAELWIGASLIVGSALWTTLTSHKT